MEHLLPTRDESGGGVLERTLILVAAVGTPDPSASLGQQSAGGAGARALIGLVVSLAHGAVDHSTTPLRARAVLRTQPTPKAVARMAPDMARVTPHPRSFLMIKNWAMQGRKMVSTTVATRS